MNVRMESDSMGKIAVPADKYWGAQSDVIDAILQNQNLNVQTVSGATFSSNGILEAVADALNVDFTNPNSTMSSDHGRH